MLRVLGRYASVFLLVSLWEAAARARLFNPVLFPPASTIAGRLVALTWDGTLVYHAGQSLGRMAAGYGLALLVGIPLGLLMGRRRGVEGFFAPVFAFGFPVPKIGLIPIFLLFFGLGHGSKVALVFVDALFPVVINSFHGAQIVEAHLVWSARAMGDSEAAILRRVVWPASLPHVFTGIRLGLIVSLIVVFLSEMVAAGSGLGHVMILAARNFKIVEMYTAILAIGLIGFALDKLLLALRARVLAWSEQALEA
ncbi:MAG: ABC transporter permease [Candidatus Rokubacteria bacterium]|nr:ABC transporter permease [Candidatus Rokubacteria bacterium]